MQTALIVDDNDINREVIGDFLDSVGVSICMCQSAVQALAELETKRFDFLFLDIHMPDLNGQDFLQLTYDELEAKGTAVVILTGDETVTEAALRPFSKTLKVLYKPIDLDDIDRIVSS